MLNNIGKSACKAATDINQRVVSSNVHNFLNICKQNRRVNHGTASSQQHSQNKTGSDQLWRSYSVHTAESRQRNKPFSVIGEEVRVNQTSEQFVRNKANWEKTVQRYKECVVISVSGGGEKAIERHVKRHGKMLISDRVNALVDNADDFLELSLIAGIGMDYGHVPRANILTGIGKVMGRYCLITAMDGAFKGGAIYPITLKKQLRAQEIALQNCLPCIYIVDSAGAFLPLQADIFNPGGQGFYNEAVMSAAKIPQIAIVCGSCTAGGAYIPTMADEAVIVDKAGTVFLGGPPLVQAALGEIVSAEELGGATLHCRTSGCTDYFAENEAEAFKIGRNIIACLKLPCNTDLDISDFEEPIYDIDDIPGSMPPFSLLHTLNIYQIIARIVDGSRFHEFKALYGRSLITGFAHISGHLVGIIANQGVIGEKEAVKASHFIQLCCERDVPLIFLQNTISDVLEASSGSETDAATRILLKSRAQMLAAVCCASVPKLTVIVGGGFGSSHYLMGGRAVKPSFLFAWPNAHVAIMEPVLLAQAVAQQETRSKDGVIEDLKKRSQKYHEESSTIFGATRMLNDGIILPQETRKVLSQCLAICKAYRPREQQDYPVFRF
ncbi:hypothetical protein BsWGS_19683 [Bradybaena similaris]